uniref:Uncharacterized protein n=1 Tax=Triticum urartu TaxID=4572 RepID=A0A8R7UCY1_TRIUA
MFTNHMQDQGRKMVKPKMTAKVSLLLDHLAQN